MTVSAEQRDNGLVRISVHDNGPGIPEEFRSRIFGKFLQADSSVRRDKGGTGLGLHITREIVRHMGGQIGFDTIVGEGTTFWIDFPYWFPQLNDAAGTLAEGVDLALRAADINRQKILVCEDDALIAVALQMQLEEAGFTADIATSIAAARKKLGEETYTAITLDLGFPGESGADFIHELKANPSTAGLSIVVVSAKPEEGRKQLNGDAIGIVDWLSKPFDEHRLISALHRAAYRQQPTGRPRVLHIEDDSDLSDMLATALGDNADLINVTTLTAANEHLSQETYALIVLDPGLPDGNGLTLLGKLNDYTSVPIPVLILSANEAPGNVQAQVAGAMVKSRMSETKVVEAILSLINNGKMIDYAS